MVSGECHCGAVAFKVAATPPWLTECNCSICRRIAALWFHVDVAMVTFNCKPDTTMQYTWGDRSLAFHRCRCCGCVTHWAGLDGGARMAVNMRMADPAAVAGLRIRHFDGADTWRFLD